MNFKISVVICTLNRPQYIETVVHSVKNQTLQKDKYEVLVIDNGSTEVNKAAMKRLQSGMGFKYIYEPRTGLSHARNRGVQEARGEVVAFIDDDAEAEPEWLEGLLSSYRDDRIACVGGEVNSKMAGWVSKTEVAAQKAGAVS